MPAFQDWESLCFLLAKARAFLVKTFPLFRLLTPSLWINCQQSDAARGAVHHMINQSKPIEKQHDNDT